MYWIKCFILIISAKAGSDSLGKSKENQTTRYSVSVEHKKESLDDSDEVS